MSRLPELTPVAGRPSPEILLRHDSTQIDGAVNFVITGVTPGDPVEAEASARDESGVGWRSRAVFTADVDGTVDPGRQAPVTGTYRGADPAGLFWSMRPDRKGAFFDHRIWTPVVIRLTASAVGCPTAVRDLSLTFARPGVTRSLVSGDGLTGRLFRPGSAAPAPGAILLAGSDAASLDPAAALLASHGYVVLFLPYFGVRGLPPTLQNIPVEYVSAAIDWLSRDPGVRAGGVAVIGLSRGAELALQVASLDSRVTAVVAGAPSSVRQAGIGRGYSDFSQPAWLSAGRALPFVPGGFTLPGAVSLTAAWLLRRPVRQTVFFRRALRPSSTTRAAGIEVEKIRGPVLVIAGTDDGLWPSDRFAVQIMERLAEHWHPFGDRCLLYEGAGHFVCFPYALPLLPPMTTLSVSRSMSFDFGGTPRANAAAASASWQEILRFLGQALVSEAG
ncbi:MAG TPA: acyl-CoA thioesterase/bile acid-CoA:amino acid N-acyltransferase family protein [Streptosporangiaceae bacterium]|nr:acyl-CoA thioesterase/bile acid-CoA:amino acid N-acyltransferase family protein [Streptosporangiaceae bacterium]